MDTGFLPPRHLLQGRYRIVALVGHRGMTAVYRAEDTELDNRLVVVEELSVGGLNPQTWVMTTEQFRREASLVAGLRHPNLPHLDAQFQEAGRQYLVLEYIEGETLETSLRRAPGGALPVEEVLQLGIQLAEVLEYLQTRTPAMRSLDLKPANIMRTPTGRLYVIGFGMARLDLPGQAEAILFFGSPDDAAPEQRDRKAPDGRDDITRLGALLHHVLSGRDPASTTPGRGNVPRLQMPDAPGLESLMLQMVQPEGQQRPASMTEVKWRLQALAEDRAARHQGHLLPETRRAGAPPTVQVQSVSGGTPQPRRPGASRRVKLTVAALCVGVRAALLVIAFLAIPKGPGSTSQLGGKRLCIASEFPTTGPDAVVGQPSENGVTLAAAARYVLGSGYTLELRHFNDVSPDTGIHSPDQGARNVQQMLQDPCIVGMVGPFNSNVAAAEMPVAARGDLTMVSPSNTNPGLTLPSYATSVGFDYDALHPAGTPNVYFRLTANDVVQGQLDADFTVGDLAARRVYVVEDSEPYGQILADAFARQVERRGGTVLGRAEIPAASPDLGPTLSIQIAATHPQAVFYDGVTAGGAGPLRAQLAVAGFEGPFVVGDGVTQDGVFLTQAGSAAENTYGTFVAPDLSTFTSATQEQFLSDYQARFTSNPDPYSALAYDAAALLITAIKSLVAAGTAVTRETVRRAVQQIQYTGLTGRLSFDEHGDNSGQRVFSIYTVKNGQWMFFKQVTV